jgi:hypothetical protein
MEFIRDHGNDVAERYLLHGNARSYAGMQEYDRHAVQLGSEPFSQEHREDARATKDALIARFGKAYTDQYGWAASVLPRTRKGQPAGPTFAQIEEAVAMQASRPWYRFASEGQHAGVGALDFTLGLTHGPPLLLVGASDMGMFDPGTNTGRTLLHATTTFLGSRPDVRAVSAMFLVVVLGRQLEDAFWQAYQSIDYGEGDDHLASAAE